MSLKHENNDMTEQCVADNNTALKELSDDEILSLWVTKNNLNGAQGIIDFARAILKKASEK